MYPIIAKIGPLEIRSWGLFVMVGFIVGGLIAAKEAKKQGYKPDFIYDLTFYVIIASIIGARIFFVIEKWDEFFKINPLKIFAVWEGGLIFFGGVLLAVPVAIFYIKRKGLSVWKVGDWIAPGFAIGISIGRIGCFFNGCCFGKPTSLPWGVIFSPESAAGSIFPNVPLHPTQLYESVGDFLVFLILTRLKKTKPFDGFLLLVFAILASLVRFIDDFFRFYEHHAYILGPLTFNQVISLAIIGLSAILLLRRVRRC